MSDRLPIPKIDTKEKMHVITLGKTNLTASMTESYREVILPYLKKPVKNLVLNFSEVQSVDMDFAREMVDIQQQFYHNGASMVICNLPGDVKKFLDEADILDVLNTTLTESEAWDIVQMEEIEREFL